MAKSISQRQKNVKLEDIGEVKSGPIQLDATEEYLLSMAAKFKIVAENELNKRNKVNTGLLADSIQFTGVMQNAGVLSVDIKVLEYFKFVNAGVRGTQSGSSLEGFAFKNNSVGKSFMQAIRKWMIREKIKATAKEVKKKPLGTEKKGVSFDRTNQSLAYAIATSIKKKGLAPTGFWNTAADEVTKEMEKSMGDAFSIDIINEITK
jgi:hypothetical protein